jgi:hypothetical protein
VGFWSSFLHSGEPATSPAVASDASGGADGAPAPPALDHVARLVTFCEASGPSEDEALRLFAAARVTSHEGLAIDRLMQAHARSPLPARLAIAIASAMLDRGDRASARDLLAATRDQGALLLLADLLAEDGDFAGAVATIERVLVRDLDLPGARERRIAWRARLGLSEASRRADPAAETVAVPRPRAPFDLVREIGRGGAGVVYAATDRELGRPVALKMYHRPDRDRAQLLHEARVATALEGPGVVRVFDIEPEEGWLALEWAPYGALRDLLRKADATILTPLDRWLPSLARALARVHAAGWVHHDVKPANVLVAGGPEPWLSDFGNARRAGEPSPPGSFGYVSPERLAGRPSDPRDDVYALGRVIEDVLAVPVDHGDAARWMGIAARCVGGSDTRPRDGEAIVALMESSLVLP